MVASPPPTIPQIIAGIHAAHGTDARCLEPVRGQFVCAATYRGRCIEFYGRWVNGTLLVQPLRSANRPCVPLARKHHRPAA